MLHRQLHFLGLNIKDLLFIQNLCPVGSGPSGKTCPKWESHWNKKRNDVIYHRQDNDEGHMDITLIYRGVTIHPCTDASRYFFVRSTIQYMPPPPKRFQSNTIIYLKHPKKRALHKWVSKTIINKHAVKNKLLLPRVHTIHLWLPNYTKSI
jgi:hypothetical protein